MTAVNFYLLLRYKILYQVKNAKYNLKNRYPRLYTCMLACCSTSIAKNNHSIIVFRILKNSKSYIFHYYLYFLKQSTTKTLVHRFKATD